MSANFIDQYLYCTGLSEVPVTFHRMACLSLLAASVGERCWFVRDAGGRRIYPNLYVFLIGPSGSGKEYAITHASKFAQDLPEVGFLASTGITKQAIIDRLDRAAKQPAIFPHDHLLYLVTEELGMSVPDAERGRELIKFMTGQYIPSGLQITEHTRMHGEKIIPKNRCFNWLAGTNDAWLVEAVERSSILGGFFARVLSVRGRRDGSIRHANITYPPDRDKVMANLLLRFEMYTKLRAQFVKTKDAAEWYQTWYESHEYRPSPTDPLLEASFNRDDEMVHRLALLLTLAEMDNIPGYECEIPVTSQTFYQAVELWQNLQQGVPETIRVASATRESTDVDTVGELIRRHSTIDHSTLLKRVGNHAINASRLKTILSELEYERQVIKSDVEAVGHGKTKRVYKWMT